MSCVKYFCLLSLISLIACGQNKKVSLKISPNDIAKVTSFKNKSISYQNAQPDSAVYYADMGLRLSRRLHYSLGEAIMLDRLARINEQYENLKLAEKYQTKSAEIFNELHSVQYFADASANLGILKAKQGNFSKGSQLVEKALTVYIKNKDTTSIVKAYCKLGAIRELNGNLNKALEYYNMALELNKHTPITDDYFSIISNIGNLHTKLGNHQQAADYYKAGINKSGTKEYGKSHIALLNNAGSALNRMGNKEEALRYHRQGLQKANEMGLNEEAARSLMGIADVLKKQDADLSIQHLKNALDIAKTIKNKQLSTEIYRSLADIFRQQSRYKEALTALEQHHQLLDSLLNINKSHKIAALQSSYALAESRLHVESLELANKTKTYERNISIYTAIAIFLILLLLTGYFYKTNLLNKRLQASNLVKDKLFSIIGHDLRNPIGGITQLLSVMEEDKLTIGEYSLMVTEMRKQGDTALEILNSLLSWGQAQLKGIHIDSIHFGARTSIDKNIQALQKQANDKQIQITVNVLPELTVYGDHNHFDFIIRNLISNAIKFSLPGGTIVVEATTTAASNEVIFSVTDYGKGISKMQQQFFSKSGLDISFGTNGEKGTGIGLMLSKEFLRASGLTIWIQSEEGNGATFYFTFLKDKN